MAFKPREWFGVIPSTALGIAMILFAAYLVLFVIRLLSRASQRATLGTA